MDDPSGYWPKWVTKIVNKVNNTIKWIGNKISESVKAITNNDKAISAIKGTTSGVLDSQATSVANRKIPEYTRQVESASSNAYRVPVSNLKPIAKLGKESLAAAGSFTFTAIDMGVSVSKCQYYGALIDLTVGALGFLAGVGIATLGAPALIGLGAGIIISVFLDSVGSTVKNNYYNGDD